MPTARKAAMPAERFIVLLRHDDAEERAFDGSDEDRSLTPEGHARMKRVGQGLSRILPRAQAIYSSPLVRTTQTALWVSRAYRSRVAVTPEDALGLSASPNELLAFIRSLRSKRAVLVGHQPGLTAAFRELTGIDSSIELRPGSAFGIRLLRNGSGSLEWVLTAEIMAKIGG